MRPRLWSWMALAGLAACSTVQSAPSDVSGASRREASRGPAAAQRTVDEERVANLAGYRFVYLPEQQRLVAEKRGQWLAIAGGQVVPARGETPAPAASLELADQAARAAAPFAKHRFVFQIGEEGDVDWDLGGCELPHVLGTHFLALLERDDVAMKFSLKHPSILHMQGDRTVELVAPRPEGENRIFVQPAVGAPGADGGAGPLYVLSTGFGGMATMAPGTSAGLELWEIPGTAHVTGVLRSGDCRRARARFRWANTPLDFTVPVAIWPK